MKKLLRVGSRESKLAMVQSNWVIDEIRNKHPGLEFEIVGIKTKGDAILDTRLEKVGGKGLFIKELENALIENKIDIAVHSMKDMPACIPDELIIAAVSRREDPFDVLVTKDGEKLDELKYGAVIGTGSIRREVQLKRLRPDLKVELLRGNVLTRLDKLTNNRYDALILAAAGLRRLGLYDNRVKGFDILEMIPAVGQGVLAVETRKSDDISYLLDSVHNVEAEIAISAERAFMIKLDGGCTTPIAAHAVLEGDNVKVHGMIASNDGERFVRASVEGLKDEAEALGIKLAEMLRNELRGT